MSLRVLTQGGGGGEFASIFITGLDENSTVTATKGGKTVQGKWAPRPVLTKGYTQLAYIQGTGAQYFNTGVNPKYNTRLVMEVSDATATSGAFFGVRAKEVAGDATSFGLLKTGANSFRSDYFGTHMSFSATDVVGKTTIDKNKNVTAAFGETVTHTSVSSGSGDYALDLFAMNTKGTHGFYGSFKMYSCKIYDDETLIRDYIPVKRDSDGAIGVYDLVNGGFYQSVTSTAFIAGEEFQHYVSGHKIAKIKEYGMWTVTATDGENTTTQDVLVDAAIDFYIELDYSA